MASYPLDRERNRHAHLPFPGTHEGNLRGPEQEKDRYRSHILLRNHQYPLVLRQVETAVEPGDL